VTAPRTAEPAERTVSRTGLALYRMLTASTDEIEDPMALAQQLLAIRDTVREALGEIDEAIDCAVSEVMTSDNPPTYDVAAAVLKISRSTVQDHAKRGRVVRERSGAIT
jgi:hypothetical protein